MKMHTLFIILGMLMCFVTSCSSDESIYKDEEEVNDSVYVSFNFTGLDVEEMPMSKKTEKTSATYYHINIRDLSLHPNNDNDCSGYYGFFTDLREAKIRLPRNREYEIRATALIESETKIKVDDNSFIYEYHHLGTVDTINIYNHFSNYFTNTDFMYGGACESPQYVNQSIDRYYNTKSVRIDANETINIKLNRFSYKLTCIIDPPVGGYSVLSCQFPKFNYRVSTNDSQFTKSTIYSIGGTDLSTVNRVISLKYEMFNSQSISTCVSTKDISVKPNVNTIVKIKPSEIVDNNSFNITLDDHSMKDEEYNWY